MPANLPPHYYTLEREFKAERDPKEKLRLAQELLALMPKHKGTDKLQADMKAKISKLKKQIDSGGKKGGAARAEMHDHIDKEGAGQIVLIGPPNSGKSSLLDILTHAEPLVADYPYTTREPLPGMMVYKAVQMQLIDTPPIGPDMFETWLLGIIRNADLVCFVADVSHDRFEDDCKYVVDKLEERRILLSPSPPDPEEVDEPGLAYKKTIVAAHKYYDEGGAERAWKLKAFFPGFVIVGTSILDEASLEQLKKAFFEGLNIIRVFTKNVGHEPDYNDPIILPPGATVEDAAFALHKDFAYRMKYAKVWGEGKFDGQRVQKNYKLVDGDVVEFHI